ncbi:18222_t:CDS:1, partial [Racocetra persica]
MPSLRERAHIQVTQQQAQVKDHYDKHQQISARFKIDKKVLLENAAKKYSCSNKFTSKYKRPFYIYNKLINDAYKLQMMDSK